MELKGPQTWLEGARLKNYLGLVSKLVYGVVGLIHLDARTGKFPPAL